MLKIQKSWEIVRLAFLFTKTHICTHSKFILFFFPGHILAQQLFHFSSFSGNWAESSACPWNMVGEVHTPFILHAFKENSRPWFFFSSHGLEHGQGGSSADGDGVNHDTAETSFLIYFVKQTFPSRLQQSDRQWEKNELLCNLTSLLRCGGWGEWEVFFLVVLKGCSVVW